jgi:hypothetical protein
VHDGTLEAADEQISIDVFVALWESVLPGASAEIEAGKAEARDQMHDTIHNLVRLLDAFAVRPKGSRLSTVRVDDGNNGAGLIEFTTCAQDLLVRFAELSGVVVIE